MKGDLNFLAFVGVQKRMAADLCRDKKHAVVCTVCPHTVPITKQEFAQYLAGGWPKHCGQTMQLLSEPR